MTPPHDGDRHDVLLMGGDDRFSEEVRRELHRRGIGYAEIDPGRMQGVVMPTLVLRGGCAAGDVSYEGFGRIRREFLVHYDVHGDAPTPEVPAG